MSNKKSPNRRKRPSWRSKAGGVHRIERYSSPKSFRVDESAGPIFSAFVFTVTTLVVLAAGCLLCGAANIWLLVFAFVVGVLAILTIRIAPQWRRDVVLRLGKYHKTAGPGVYFTVPFIDHVALKADQRIMLTGFSAEETLTQDLVPVNVDAVLFWMVWDAEKACIEVEDYYDAVSVAAQTALRDAIGRKDISDVAVHRNKLDEELRNKIEEKTAPWGVSIISVEIRDIVIPKKLQHAMSAEARAERERSARIVLAEVESDIASMLHDASKVYYEDEIALRLRKMHLVSQSLKDSAGSLVVPSAYTEGFVADSPESDMHRSSASSKPKGSREG